MQFDHPQLNPKKNDKTFNQPLVYLITPFPNPLSISGFMFSLKNFKQKHQQELFPSAYHPI